jgi:hypothetical protein
LILLGLTGTLWGSFIGTKAFSIDEAHEIAERYLNSMDDQDLAIAEVMEFEDNFYVVYNEKSTRIGAFEMLIDKGTRRIFPEYGPNMMWNAKYGHHGTMGSGMMMGGSWSSGGAALDEEEAVELAQVFLDKSLRGAVADDPHPFYGYFTFHTVRDGEIFGMLSVNSLTGAVWYHDWHGAYIGSLEEH